MNQLVPFELESILVISEWNYDCPNGTCPICTTSLYEIPSNKIPSNKILSNKMNKKHIPTSIVQSECLHTFHYKCLKTYLKQQTSCPICLNTEIKFKKELEGLSTIKLFKA
jgi:hypothetical protein